MTTLRRLVSALLLTTSTACATLPASAPDSQRYRAGAFHSSLGSSMLVLGGASMVASGATYVGMRGSDDAAVSSSAGSGAMLLVLGGLAVGMVGAYFLDRAADDFAPLDLAKTATVSPTRTTSTSVAWMTVAR